MALGLLLLQDFAFREDAASEKTSSLSSDSQARALGLRVLGTSHREDPSSPHQAAAAALQDVPCLPADTRGQSWPRPRWPLALVGCSHAAGALGSCSSTQLAGSARLGAVLGKLQFQKPPLSILLLRDIKRKPGMSEEAPASQNLLHTSYPVWPRFMLGFRLGALHMLGERSATERPLQPFNSSLCHTHWNTQDCGVEEREWGG